MQVLARRSRSPRRTSRLAIDRDATRRCSRRRPVHLGRSSAPGVSTARQAGLRRQGQRQQARRQADAAGAGLPRADRRCRSSARCRRTCRIDPKGVDTPPRAGPYYIRVATRASRSMLKRNPNYKGTRPHNLDTINSTIGNSLDATLAAASSRATTDYARAASRRRPTPRLGSAVRRQQAVLRQAALGDRLPRAEHDRAAVQGNRNALRQAVNYAIDRPAMLRQRGASPASGPTRSCRRASPGFKDANLYPTQAAEPREGEEVAGQRRHEDGKTVCTTTSNRTARAAAQISSST